MNLVAEAQDHDGNFLRLSEFSESRPLHEDHIAVLLSSVEELQALGLKLVADLDGHVRLTATGVVGIARFVQGRDQIVVQVEPKIKGVDVFRMLDTVYGASEGSSADVEIPLERGSPTVLFLHFFLKQVRAFLSQSSFRGYRFAETALRGRVRGRPLIRQYVEGSVPRGKPQVMPCRYVDFSADVFENQVLAYSLHAASGLIDLLDAQHRTALSAQIRECTRMLPGVRVKRIDLRDLDAHRYSRATEGFHAIHRLCRVVIAGYRTSFAPGSRVPFTSFAVNMGDLFERYVVAILRRAFPGRVLYTKPDLTHDVSPFGKTVELDALLIGDTARTVIECKYKDISKSAARDPSEWIGDKVRSADLYQTVAYASHRGVSATQAMIFYPSWSPGAVAIELSPASFDFGWYAGARASMPCHLVGMNLSADYAALAAALGSSVAPLADLVSRPATSDSSSRSAS